MGQALLPAHLRAMEESLLADSAIRFNQQEAPAYGLSRLRWHEALLAEGVLSLDEMTLVLPSGLLLKLKDNAQASTLNFNLAGGSVLPVFLHVRNLVDEQDLRENSRTTVKRESVNCWLWSLELTVEQENPDTRETFLLAEFQKQPDGLWQLSTRYIPPLTCLGSVPFLKDEITALTHRIDAYHYQLTQEITAIYLSGSDLINAKQCLKSVVQMQRFLANVCEQITPHPYTVYEQLKHFYVDLCFHHNATPHAATVPYRHDKLAELFNETFELLSEQLRLSQLRSPYLPFTLEGGLVKVALPKAIREAKEVYLLVQKSGIAKSVNLDNLKLAAVSRVPVAHKFYLQGIPFKRIDRAPFQHSFGPEVDLYQLGEGEEWDHALNELAMGFYADSKYADEKFFLYWRSD